MFGFEFDLSKPDKTAKSLFWLLIIATALWIGASVFILKDINLLG